MVPILFRAFSTIVTVVIAVVVSAVVGDSPLGKVWAAVLIAFVIALAEWLINWAPKHSALARKLLDNRASMVGMWVQNVDRVLHGQEGIRFSIFWVYYKKPEGYAVAGYAYNPEGKKYAAWWSVGSPEFGEDGRSMTYRWGGTVMEGGRADDDAERTGIASISIDKEGKVEHVGMNLSLCVNIQRVTVEWLSEIGLGQYQPDDLREQEIRDAAACAYARGLPPPARVTATAG